MGCSRGLVIDCGKYVVSNKNIREFKLRRKWAQLWALINTSLHFHLNAGIPGGSKKKKTEGSRWKKNGVQLCISWDTYYYLSLWLLLFIYPPE